MKQIVARIARYSVVFIFLSATGIPAAAQPMTDPTLQGRVLQRTDGSIFIYKDGLKYPIQPVPLLDEELDGIPDGSSSVSRLDQFFSAPPPPAPAPASAPPTPSTTPPGAVLNIGDTWMGDGINLTLKGSAYSFCDAGGGNCANRPTVDFNVQNASDLTLNFTAPDQGFYLELSSGKRFKGIGWRTCNACADLLHPIFNNFEPLTGRDFSMMFDWDSGLFDAAKRDSSIQYYIVGVIGFGTRIPEAKWKESIAH